MNNESVATDNFSTPIFSRRLGDLARLELSRFGRRRFIAKHDYVFRAGDPAHCICVVEYGHLKISEPTSEGRDVLMFIRAPDEILGLRGALQGDGKGIRSYSAQACEDTGIICVPVDKLRSYLETHPKMALEVAEILARRLNETCEKLSVLSLSQVPSRVAHLILNVGQCYGTYVGSGVELNVPFSQQEIADMVGAARQTVSGIINELKLDGVISVSQKFIRIENIDKLKNLALDCGSPELDARSGVRRLNKISMP